MTALLKRKRSSERRKGATTMASFPRMLLTAIVLTVAQLGTCYGAETVRVAVQKSGTFAWELAVIRAHGLDQKANLSVQDIELASPEAGKIALRAGSADIIVSDWLWVSRERGLGAKLTFYPYSSALGAVMVPAASPIRKLADLRSRKLAVAGGPLDKSWLLLQVWSKQGGIDLKSESTIVYGAPPLLTAKALDGEMDATLNYWNFCAVLEAKGFHRLIGIEDVVLKLGATGRTAMIGYVFDEDWASANQDVTARFIAMTRAAKEILATSDAEWEKIAALTGAADPATLRAYRDHYRKGIPRRPIADEEADARILYHVLATIGGPELVGQATELDSGTFYHAIPGD
jgi:NitT/TauT family transport system substrate-binding protein